LYQGGDESATIEWSGKIEVFFRKEMCDAATAEEIDDTMDILASRLLAEVWNNFAAEL
jgi:hypothetical protein